MSLMTSGNSRLAQIIRILSIAIGIASTTIPGKCQSTGSPVVLTERASARFLDQATWGPTTASIARLHQMGIENWLEWQFSLNSTDIPDQSLLALDLAPVQNAFFTNAIHGEDQLRQRVAFALSKIWVVSAVQFDPVYPFPPYWRVLKDNAFGNYRDIIEAITLNPAMGDYLSMANNNKGNTAFGTMPNENYARELMQLFTLGLAQLTLDGSEILDSNQNPIPTFNQIDVENMAMALTGWTYPTTPGAIPKNNNPPYYFGQMFTVEQNHDTSPKTILGNITITSGQTAKQDLASVIDALMQQETMAPFICRQLIQQLVTSNPGPAYVQRVAKVFLDNGRGIRGDMKDVISAILTDPEARAEDYAGVLADPNSGHLREPVLFITNVLRGLNAKLGRNTKISVYASKLGQDLFRAPSVFSYFSPRYQIEDGLLGPEFQILSTQTAIERINFIRDVLSGGFDRSTTIDLTPFSEVASDIPELLDLIGSVFMHRSMSQDLYQAAFSAASRSQGLTRVKAALYVVLTSSEYQILR